jgi:hypothetical protein
LREWLLSKIETNNREHTIHSDIHVANQISLYNVAFTDLSRQVSIQCIDRGRLMLEIWMGNTKLFEWLIHRLSSQKNHSDKRANVLSKQISDLLGSILQSKDLQEVIRDKEQKIVQLEAVARDVISREEASERAYVALKSQQSHLEGLYQASKEILVLLMPRSQSYCSESSIAVLLEPLTDKSYMPTNVWEQLEQDVNRLILTLFMSNNRHIHKRLFTLVSSSMRDKGEILPPGPMESILEGELSICKRNLSEALVEANNLTLSLSAARMTTEGLQFENKDLKRRLSRECHINALMDTRFREFEQRLRQSDASDPQRYESLRWIHSLVRNKEDASSGNVSDASLTVIRKDLAAASKERAQTGVSQPAGKKDFLSTLRAARQRAAEDANLSAGLPDHLKMLFASEFQHYDSYHFLYSRLSPIVLVELSIQILLFKAKDDAVAFRQHLEPKSLMQIIMLFFLETCGNPWSAEFLAWIFVLNIKSSIAEHRLIQAMSAFLGMFDTEAANEAHLALYIYIFVDILNAECTGNGFVAQQSLWVSSTFMQKKVEDWETSLGIPVSLSSIIKSHILADSNNNNIEGQPKEYQDRKKMEFFSAIDTFCTHHVAFTECVNLQVKTMYANVIMPMIAKRNCISLKELHNSLIKLNMDITLSDSAIFLMKLQRKNQSLFPSEVSFCDEIRKGWVPYYASSVLTSITKLYSLTSSYRLLFKELFEHVSAYQTKLANKRSHPDYAHLASEVDFTEVDLALLMIRESVRRGDHLDDRGVHEQLRSLLSCLWDMRYLDKKLEPA